MKCLFFFLFLLLASYTKAQFLQPATPDKIYGDLFTDVQTAKRRIKLNTDIYKSTGKPKEKDNVTDIIEVWKTGRLEDWKYGS